MDFGDETLNISESTVKFCERSVKLKNVPLEMRVIIYRTLYRRK